MEFPIASAYVKYIGSPNTLLGELSGAEIIKNKMMMPLSRAGSFGVVFQIKKNNGKLYALKCFTKDIPKREFRLKRIAEYINSDTSNYFVDFEYLEKGIEIEMNGRKKKLPCVVMERFDGKQLNDYLKDNNDTGKLSILKRNIEKLFEYLDSNRIAHGDLQHGNILVDDLGNVKLVDYDGMFIPVFRGEKSNEIGLPNYQHPKRLSGKYFDENIDRFPKILIWYAISLLIKDYNFRITRDKNSLEQGLLFKEEDLKSPSSSKLLNDIQNKGYGELPNVDIFRQICEGDFKNIPTLSEFVTGNVALPTDKIVTLNLLDTHLGSAYTTPEGKKIFIKTDTKNGDIISEFAWEGNEVNGKKGKLIYKANIVHKNQARTSKQVVKSSSKPTSKPTNNQVQKNNITSTNNGGYYGGLHKNPTSQNNTNVQQNQSSQNSGSSLLGGIRELIKVVIGVGIILGVILVLIGAFSGGSSNSGSSYNNSNGKYISQSECSRSKPSNSSCKYKDSTNGYGWICNSGYTLKFGSCKKDDKSCNENGCCDEGSCVLGDKCYKMPENAKCKSGDPENARECKSGYAERGGSGKCYKASLIDGKYRYNCNSLGTCCSTPNSCPRGSSTGDGYCYDKPLNSSCAFSSTSKEHWICNSGYYESNGRCYKY